MSQYTCQKTYSEIPFAHRQHRHDGHCSFIHGHNWSFTFTFGCDTLDECGFVVDFGKLGPLKAWIVENLDHACLFNRDDPLLDSFLALNKASDSIVFKAVVLDQCSSEGIARMMYEQVDPMIREMTAERAFVVSVNVTEDCRNSATYRPETRIA